jgi:tetratricopeptide (TPR) repeat protein
MKLPVRLTVTVLFLFVVNVAGSTASLGQDTQARQGDTAVAREFEQSRNRYWQQRRELDNRLDELRIEEAALRQQISTLEEAAKNRNRTAPLRTLVDAQEALVTTVFYPVVLWQGAAGWLGENAREWVAANLTWLLMLFVLMLYLHIRLAQKDFYSKRKAVVNIAVVFFLLALPVSGSAQERGELDTKLVEAQYIMGLSEVERYIRVLDGSDSPAFLLPAFTFDGALLTPYRQFRADTAEHFYTLAALNAHAGYTAAAIKSLERISDGRIQFDDRAANVSHITLSGARYLIRHEQYDLANELLKANLDTIPDAQTLIALYAVFARAEQPSSTRAIADDVLASARSYDDLMMLSGQFAGKGQANRANPVVSKAVASVASLEQAEAAVEVALASDDPGLLTALLARSAEVLRDVDEYFALSDLLIERGRKQAGERFVAGLIDSMGRDQTMLLDGRSVEATNALAYISIQCLARGRVEQAADAAQKLAVLLGPARFSYVMPIPESDPLVRGLHDPSNVTLLLYYGLLNERMGLHDKALTVYRQGAADLVEMLVDSNGLDYHHLLNQMVLLGGALKRAGDTRTLALVDELLVSLEALDITDRERQIAVPEAALRQSIQSLEEQVAGLQQAAADEKARDDGWLAKLHGGFALVLRFVLLLTLPLLVLAGILAVALRYMSSMRNHRIHAFVAKVFESVGWVYTLTLVGIPIGLPLVFVAQGMMMNQRVEEALAQRDTV